MTSVQMLQCRGQLGVESRKFPSSPTEKHPYEKGTSKSVPIREKTEHMLQKSSHHRMFTFHKECEV